MLIYIYIYTVASNYAYICTTILHKYTDSSNNYHITIHTQPHTHTHTHSLVLVSEWQGPEIGHLPPLVVHNFVRFGVWHWSNLGRDRVTHELPGVRDLHLGGAFPQYHTLQCVEGDHLAVPRVQGDPFHRHLNFAVWETVTVILGPSGDELHNVGARRELVRQATERFSGGDGLLGDVLGADEDDGICKRSTFYDYNFTNYVTERMI